MSQATLWSQAATAVTTEKIVALPALLSLDQLALDITVTAVSGTSPTLTVFLERQGADGQWYPVYNPAAITAVGVTSTDIGAGLTVTKLPVNPMRLRFEIGGSASPSVTFSGSLIGRTKDG